MRKLTLLSCFVLLQVAAVMAQTYLVTGKVVDGKDATPVPGAFVSLVNTADTTDVNSEMSGRNGTFSISVKPHAYKLKVTMMGYKLAQKSVTVTNSKLDVGSIKLLTDVKEISEVVIIGQVTPVAQKSDTTEMSAKAYKVTADADAQALVQKMPGITVENGTVKAHGEEIKRVMIDGKNFFGDDVSMSLQNIPADMIDKVQVYNKLSDQAAFTGFDDGQGQKVMNIITRADRRVGKNGKFTAGYGNAGKYTANGRLNLSDADRKLTILAGSNNVNQQNFSAQDMFGSMRGGGGGGNAFIGRMNGLNTIHTLGLNFTDQVNKDLSVTASYFFNQQDNNSLSETNMQYLGVSNSVAQALYQQQQSKSVSSNYNHRFDSRIEYQIDSFNSIIFNPRFSLQQNQSNVGNSAVKYSLITLPMLTSIDSSATKALGFNYSGDLTFRHKFRTQGRTLSIGIQTSGNQRDMNGPSISSTQSPVISLYKNLENDSKTNAESYSSNVAYTEPLWGKSMLQVAYNYATNYSSADKYVYNNMLPKPILADSLLSNVFRNQYTTQRAGLSYLLRNLDIMNVTFGVDYQMANLTGKQTYPKASNVDKIYHNFLPNAMINYKMSKNINFRAFYRTSTNAPSASQMQDVVDVSNSTYFSKGNPDLQPQYTHNIMSNFRLSNPEKFVNFSINVFGSYNLNPIGNRTFIMRTDTVIQGQQLLRNGQLVVPWNMSNSWNSNLFLNYGFLYQPLKCNITFLSGIGYFNSPGYVNDQLSVTGSTNYTGGVVVASNISQNVDFTASYNANYTHSENAQIVSLNNNTWYHSINLNSNFIMWKGITFKNTLNEQINRGLGSGYNQEFLLWNIGVGKKMFSNNGELTFNVNDVLDQNKSITHSVSELAITDGRTNTIGRYFMITFTYNLRSYKPQGDGFGPPGGFPPGGFPGGGFPGGGPRGPM